MSSSYFIKAGVLTLFIVAVFIVCWEGFWRSKGFTPTFNDDKALWAAKRTEVYRNPDHATIFIGSSRIKFDLDIPTWKTLTKEEAIQLSLVGTSPILLLKDLAEDERFKGKLVIDVTEELFFSKNPFFHKSAKDVIAYYKKQTPSERLSASINFALESKLAFLEESKFSLNTLLNDLQLTNRPGVFSFPAFPKGFDLTKYDRQTYMSRMFLSDSSDLKWQTTIWSTLVLGDKTPPVAGEALNSVFSEIKTAVNRIRARGGRVIFIRTPSSGVMAEEEQKTYPRTDYWDQLLLHTKCEGIHYADYPETKDLVCPEWSHLSPEQAAGYTHHLANVLSTKGWFSH